MPDKIHVMAQAMQDNPDIMLLTSNYIAFRDKDKSIINTHMKYIDRDDGAIIRLRLHDTWLENLRPGCTYCFRSKLTGKFSVFDIENRAHDSMLWKYAIISDSLGLINRQLIRYRRHDGTATRVLKEGTRPASLAARVRGTAQEADFYMKLANAPAELGMTRHNKELLTRKAEFLTRRSHVLNGKNLLAITLFVLANIRYYPTVRNALSDIYAAIFLR